MMKMVKYKNFQNSYELINNNNLLMSEILNCVYRKHIHMNNSTSHVVKYVGKCISCRSDSVCIITLSVYTHN